MKLISFIIFLSFFLVLSFSSVYATIEKGQTAPEFSATDQNGNTITIANYKESNLLLYFMKYLDEPSKREIMALDKFKKEKITAFLNIVLISANQKGYDDTLNYLKEEKIEFPLILDSDKKLQMLYDINYQFPTVYGVDQDSKIICRKIGFIETMDNFLGQFMKDTGQDMNYKPAASGKPWIGLLVIKLPDYLKQIYGVDKGLYVGKVIPNSPAQRAGFLVGDLITTFDEKAVEDEGDLKDIIQSKKAGDQINVTLIRRKPSAYTLNMIATAKPGWSLDEIPDALESLYNSKKGLVIKEISKNSAAEKCGFKSYDLLTGANNTVLEEKSQLEKLLTSKSGQEIKFSFIRLTNETLKTKVKLIIK